MQNTKKNEAFRIIKNTPEENMKLLLKHMGEQRDSELQNALFKKLIRDYAVLAEKLKENYEIIERLSETDKLTQIYNRVKFDDILELEVDRSKRYKTPLGLIVFDIDFFKKVNDTFGHAVGDSVLVELAGIVKNEIRLSDIFARWGGEEFVILAPETQLEEIRALAEKIRKKIADHCFKNAGKVTCSFGCSQFDENLSVSKWFNKTDKALYKAKKDGRNCVEKA